MVMWVPITIFKNWLVGSFTNLKACHATYNVPILTTYHVSHEDWKATVIL